jgi:hypothetical protein
MAGFEIVFFKSVSRPPVPFLAGAVQFAMMRAAERDRKFIADLLPKSARLRKAMVKKRAHPEAFHDLARPMQSRPRFARLEPARSRKGSRGGVVTIRQLEAGVNQPRRATLVVVRHTLETAGVEFIDDNGGGVGVRFREVRRERPQER